MTGRERRATALRLQSEGRTKREIGDTLGVTPGHVRIMLTYDSYRRNRVAKMEIQRRADGKRTYECGICGEKGHNSRRHEE